MKSQDEWTSSLTPDAHTLQGAAYTTALTEMLGDPQCGVRLLLGLAEWPFSPSAPAIQPLSAAHGA